MGSATPVSFGQWKFSTEKRILLLCSLSAFAFGVLWRTYFIFVSHPAKDYIYSDMKTYYTEAHRLGNPMIRLDVRDTIYPPGSAILFGLALGRSDNWRNLYFLQLIIAVAIPIVLTLIAYTLYDEMIAAVALILSSLYIAFVEYAGFLLSENPYTLFQLLSFFFFISFLTSPTGIRGLLLGFLTGVTLGVTALIRTVVFIPAIIVGAFAALRFSQPVIRDKSSLYRPIFVGLLLIVLPFTFWCSSLLGGKICVISTNGPLGILQGHSGSVSYFLFNDSSRAMVWTFQSSTAHQKGFTDKIELPFGPYDTDAVLKEAFRLIIKHPGQALVSSFVHVYDLFWGTLPWPPSHTKGNMRIIISEWMFRTTMLFPSLVYLIVLATNSSLRGHTRGYFADILVLMPILGIMVVVFFTIAEPRYRIPYDAFIILLAARAYGAGASVLYRFARERLGVNSEMIRSRTT